MSELPVLMPVNEPKRKIPLVLKLLSVLFSVICVLLVVALCLFNYLLEYHPIEGGSMMPTLNVNGYNEDAVYTFATKNVKAGDIIVAHSPQGVDVIKRYIAGGGDRVKVERVGDEYFIRIIKKGQTEVITFEHKNYGANVVPTEELYTDFYSNELDKKTFDDDWLIIPEDYFFFLGDNMMPAFSGDLSYDCADYGPISTENLVAKVIFIVYGGKNRLAQVISQIFKPVCNYRQNTMILINE